MHFKSEKKNTIACEELKARDPRHVSYENSQVRLASLPIVILESCYSVQNRVFFFFSVFLPRHLHTFVSSELWLNGIASM